MRSQQFVRYAELLSKLPNNAIDHEHLTKKMQQYLNENNLNKQLSESTEVLEILYKLYMLEKNLNAAF
jgi:hypothetical protein